MEARNEVVAWLEPSDNGAVLAAFASKETVGRRPPAFRRCLTPEEGRRWVEREAAALNVPVCWMAEPLR